MIFKQHQMSFKLIWACYFAIVEKKKHQKPSQKPYLQAPHPLIIA